jgi:hypothetical protein
MSSSRSQCCLNLLQALLAVFALITATLASFWCETIKFIPSSRRRLSIPSLHFGLWSVRSTTIDNLGIAGNVRIVVRNTCVSYPSLLNIDSSWKAARAFSVVALILGCVVTLTLVVLSCISSDFTKRSWSLLVVLCLVILPLFQGLTFLILQSNACRDNAVVTSIGILQGVSSYSDECDWDAGSSANVAAVVLWFAAGMVMLTLGPPERDERSSSRTQEVKNNNTGAAAMTEADGAIGGSEIPNLNV